MPSKRFEWAKSVLIGGLTFTGAAVAQGLSVVTDNPHVPELAAFAALASGIASSSSSTIIARQGMRLIYSIERLQSDPNSHLSFFCEREWEHRRRFTLLA